MSTDVVVVGAGAMGTAAAYELGRRGVETTLLEQFEVGHVRGSSRGPTRVFRYAYPDLDYVRLAQRAFAAWRELEDHSGEQLLRTTGAFDIGPHAGACAEALASAGVAHEWLAARAAEERFPSINFTGLDRVLYHPGAGVCRSERTIQLLATL